MLTYHNRKRKIYLSTTQRDKQMKTFTVICIEKNKTMQDMDAHFRELGHFLSVDGRDLEDKVSFNRDLWRVCCIAEVK